MISEFGRSLFTKYAFSVSRVETVKDWGDTVTALLWLKISRIHIKYRQDFEKLEECCVVAHDRLTEPRVTMD